MCRRHLAVREHMMDHILDQAPVPVSRPRTPSNFALPAPLSTLDAGNAEAVEDESGTDTTPAPRARGTSVSDVINPLTGLPGRSRRGSSAGLATPPTEGAPGRARARSVLGAGDMSMSMSRGNSTGGARVILDADQLAARLPPQLAALRAGIPRDDPNAPPTPRRLSSGLVPMLPISGPAIITNPKCSGYFVEPLTWMEPMLDGSVAGKLFCPNEKCHAKIGTYDWAGVQCGCKEWVTPVSVQRRNGKGLC
jgi:dual specificity phosphatase 12